MARRSHTSQYAHPVVVVFVLSLVILTSVTIWGSFNRVPQTFKSSAHYLPPPPTRTPTRMVDICRNLGGNCTQQTIYSQCSSSRIINDGGYCSSRSSNLRCCKPVPTKTPTVVPVERLARQDNIRSNKSCTRICAENFGSNSTCIGISTNRYRRNSQYLDNSCNNRNGGCSQIMDKTSNYRTCTDPNSTNQKIPAPWTICYCTYVDPNP